MTRKIHCEDCKTYLGEIRDATLIINIKHYCCACSEKKEPEPDFMSDLLAGKRPDINFMDDLFRGRYKR